MTTGFRTARTFWFRRRPNFGDGLAPLLVRNFAHMEPEWSRPETSDAVVIGSIAGRLPPGYRGAVVGIGKISQQIRLDLSSAHVLGLRGELTLRGSGVRHPVALGDAGLLAADLLGEPSAPVHDLGIVAHYADDALNGRFPDAVHIDVARDPMEVVRNIASCRRIVSSSLHGIITADAFGIPRMWEPSDSVLGSGFKFADYASALGLALEPRVWGEAPRPAVEAAVARLRQVFEELAGAVETLPRWRGWRSSRLWQVVAHVKDRV